MIFDPMYFIFAIPGMLFAFWAQWYVKSTFSKYANVGNMHRMNGFDVAQRLMSAEGLNYVRVNQVAGQLTDFYNPADKSINLSQSSVTPSVAAMAVVAHELGHALQDREGYTMLRLRSSIVGIANIGSSIGTWLVMGGLMFGAASRSGGFGFTMALIGLVLFAGAVLFTLVTLPVEFNASSRAKKMLIANGLVSPQDQAAVSKVLNAAAWTYVAAAAQSILTFAYFAFRVFGGRRD
ncbi:zinc metallopeptidase [Herpetosiphon giganteus]|uniref:zinc metallopeptidase n=1 Tax=Herpetosiphon giganteus TaxID=2029754 RepID=UPI00195DFC37|nr:zinc metallopeptidase [Herpetosiphon giganteus]MBM7843900.1 Zn-dependent membrane protease YugP [Herpetosiphon giganteus]